MLVIQAIEMAISIDVTAVQQTVTDPVFVSGLTHVRLYHGDLCPRNILLTFDDDVILADFGIGIKHNKHHGVLKEDMSWMKTHSVTVAPETRDETCQHLDARADL